MICERCGQCCHAFAITLSIEDMNREPRLWDVAVPIQYVRNPRTRAFMVKRGHPWVIRKERRGAPCPFLELRNVCWIYETRPQVCRDYPESGGSCIRENQKCLMSEA